MKLENWIAARSPMTPQATVERLEGYNLMTVSALTLRDR